MTRMVLLLALFSCTGCYFFAATEAVSLCDRSNVYCGDSELSERDFKESAKGSALASDFKNLAKFPQKMADKSKKDKSDRLEARQQEECLEDEEIVCTATKGCFCE